VLSCDTLLLVSLCLVTTRCITILRLCIVHAHRLRPTVRQRLGCACPAGISMAVHQCKVGTSQTPSADECGENIECCVQSKQFAEAACCLCTTPVQPVEAALHLPCQLFSLFLLSEILCLCTAPAPPAGSELDFVGAAVPGSAAAQQQMQLASMQQQLAAQVRCGAKRSS
jgi:hypothetical protein